MDTSSMAVVNGGEPNGSKKGKAKSKSKAAPEAAVKEALKEAEKLLEAERMDVEEVGYFINTYRDGPLWGLMDLCGV